MSVARHDELMGASSKPPYRGMHKQNVAKGPTRHTAHAVAGLLSRAFLRRMVFRIRR
jgi:hypothetical protein